MNLPLEHTALAVVGAGPAGLCAAVEAARSGVPVVVLDENERAGGQLFKHCLLYTSPSPRDRTRTRMPSSA